LAAEGGGRPHFAQGGGTQPAKLKEAVKKQKKRLKNK